MRSVELGGGEEVVLEFEGGGEEGEGPEGGKGGLTDEETKMVVVGKGCGGACNWVCDIGNTILTKCCNTYLIYQ